MFVIVQCFSNLDKKKIAGLSIEEQVGLLIQFHSPSVMVKKTREQVANSEVSRSVVKNQTKKMVLVTKPVGSADWTNDETCWSCHNGHIADRYFCFWHWCLDGKIKPC